MDEDKFDNFLAQLLSELQNEIGEEFQSINDVSEKGMDYLVTACHESGIALPEDWPNERLSMLLFLDHPLAFRMAYDLYAWRASSNTMSHFQFSHSEAVVDAEAIGLFKASTESFFHGQGKGDDCKIRHYQEDDGAHLLLVARGDHIQALSVWEGGNERTTFPRPLREDLLRYDPANGVLSIKAYGRSTAEVKHYVQAWTTEVLGKNQAELFTQTVVSLDPIKAGRFNYDGNELIEWIRLVDLRLTLYASKPITVRISSEDVVNSLSVDLRSIRLSGATLRSVKLAFKLNYDGASAKPVLVEVTPPNVTRMNRKKDEDIINSYLRAEGILLV
ncbi:MAG: hypothetical protein GEU75_01015 [Dehalococcoidia bacterium]|nr:hypothetical protein [Dehalococcoidia bacterium]